MNSKRKTLLSPGSVKSEMSRLDHPPVTHPAILPSL